MSNEKELDQQEFLSLDRALKHFQYTALNRYNKNRMDASRLNEIKIEKEEKMRLIRKLFQLFIQTLKLEVENSSKYSPNYIANEKTNPQIPFEVYKDEADVSDDMVYPSPIYTIRHPIRFSIAVHNEEHRKKYGLYRIIMEENSHPDKNILKHTFNTAEELCMALSEFFGKNYLYLDNQEGFLKSKL